MYISFGNRALTAHHDTVSATMLIYDPYVAFDKI